VRFPAQLPTVFAVGAVGKMKEFPADSSHAYSAIPQLVGASGVFAARFSCYGPQIAVSAPGVAVVSTMANGGYAAADGTPIAASYVSGLAALILAHHPIFLGPLKTRSEQRVEALLGLIRASAILYFPDLLHGGAGVPNVTRIPGEQAMSTALSLPPGADSLATFLSRHASMMQMRAAGLL
jgi:subtilisin family serine protease